jgi:hypothetical protein
MNSDIGGELSIMRVFRMLFVFSIFVAFVPAQAAGRDLTCDVAVDAAAMAACNKLIASGKFRGKELADLYRGRASIFWRRTAERMADLNSAITRSYAGRSI